MRAFEARAIENIATAPATAWDRRGGFVSIGVILALFAVSIPFARVWLGGGEAFLPTLEGIEILALVLTCILFYVQYRIERDLKLALLALAYGVAAFEQGLYLVTFPGLYVSGNVGGGTQTAAWAFVAAQLGFAGFTFAEGVAARTGAQLSRNAIRRLAVLTVVALIAVSLVLAFDQSVLPNATEGSQWTALWTNVVSPVSCGLLFIAALVVVGRWRTVTEIWITVVLLARCISAIAGPQFAAGRFTVNWYAARAEELIASTVVLFVFLVKINDLMLRLAARSRSTAEALAFGEARYGALANVVPQLIWTTNPNGEIEYVNDRWTAYTGYDALATREGGWRASIDPEQEAEIRDRWMQSLRTGEPFAGEFRIREGSSGRYRWFLVNAVPVRNRRAEIQTWIGTCTDIDAQKRLEDREAFLARAGERLGASLDVSATVQAIKALLLPRFADRTWIALLDDEGRYVISGVGSSDLADELATRRWIGSALQPALHDAVTSVIEVAEPLVLEKPDRFPDPWLRDVPPGAAMIVPLVSGDVPIGALALIRTTVRPYDADDVGLVRDFARRAALSLEHARLYERERTTADALQRAMLPAQLPQLPGIAFSASYSAASESQRVGGDFYDAFELSDGRVALTIGDVTGHGLEAAVIMGEIRQAIRAASFEAAEPSAILDRASRLLVASGRSVFVTAIFGVLDLVTGRFVYATAGHPPLLVYEQGAMRRLQASGLPIGLREDEGVDFAVRLRAPCTLVLYTDGLLEFARDISEGERRIENAIRTLANESIDHLANALMKAVLGDDDASDDIAILTVTIDRFTSPLPGDEREWQFSSNDGRTGALVRHEVGELVSTWTGREDTRFGSELAFGELVANAVRHAPGLVRVIVWTDGSGDATLVVEDSGRGFVPDVRRLDPFAESGRGLSLVDAVSDGLTIEPSGRGGARATVRFAPARALAPVS
ncbi:MAG TPA: SpoIIE family protein phosphatase [Candidatus Acidoferrum sp.]|nr:SpoIIE family protein phosphatase [Candidatus Acidoferrum sp.]